MSRLIVRNLPKALEKDKLAEIFASHGELTDVRICKKKSGESRRFGFVGFKNEIDATKAREYFNKSYINTSKIEVEFAKDIGDQSVPRPWSKYSTKSSEFERNLKEKTERKERIKKLQEPNSNKMSKSNVRNKDKKNKQSDKSNSLDDDDVGLGEFMKAHEKPSVKKTWANEIFDNENQTLDHGKKHGSKNDKMEASDSSKMKKVFY